MIIVITPEKTFENEMLIVNRLFENGLTILHLRKPGADKKTYENYIEKIDREFHERIVIHDHFDLVKKYKLKGIHLREGNAQEFTERGEYPHVSVSCHSLEAIDHLTFQPGYVFLSPVFDSISKPGYLASFPPGKMREELLQQHIPIIALGGVTAENASACWKAGFAGIALLGYLWQHPEEALDRFRKIPPTPVLSIAGFDPCSGAGVTADIKTFEQHRVYGLGACSAVTFQNQNTYKGTRWIASSEIIGQCELLFREFVPLYVKIGLVENFDVLVEIISYLRKKLPNVRIIWDPILKATAGQEFHTGEDTAKLESILEQVYLVTPNTEEARTLFHLPERDPRSLQKLKTLCQRKGCRILWKGGHEQDGSNFVSDKLIEAEQIRTFTVPRVAGNKHGTGCVLSAALTALLARGYTLEEACRHGQEYLEQFILSTPTDLGMHRNLSRRINRVNISDDTDELPEISNLIQNFLPDPQGEVRPRVLINTGRTLPSIRLQYITDQKEGMTVPEQVEAVCKGGARWIQLRMKNASTEEFIRVGKKVKQICERYQALFIVNDDLDAALLLEADGIHLGKEDLGVSEARRVLGPGKIIGSTCNTLEDILEAEAAKADYIGLGPYAYTSTKKKLAPVLGLEGYRNLMTNRKLFQINTPIYAIGGIQENDIPALMATGIAGIALSSLIKNSNDLSAKTTEIIRLLEKYK